MLAVGNVVDDATGGGGGALAAAEGGGGGGTAEFVAANDPEFLGLIVVLYTVPPRGLPGFSFFA